MKVQDEISKVLESHESLEETANPVNNNQGSFF